MGPLGKLALNKPFAEFLGEMKKCRFLALMLKALCWNNYWFLSLVWSMSNSNMLGTNSHNFNWILAVYLHSSCNPYRLKPNIELSLRAKAVSTVSLRTKLDCCLDFCSSMLFQYLFLRMQCENFRPVQLMPSDVIQRDFSPVYGLDMVCTRFLSSERCSPLTLVWFT